MKNHILILFLVFFVSCGGPSLVSDKFVGVYIFNYPTGQVEVLNIENDHKFIQKIYASSYAYNKNDTPNFYNQGTWSVTSGTKIEFNHWLSYCKHRNPNTIRVTPELSTMLDVYYYEADTKRKAIIEINMETNYFFTKVE